jgi:hypothetical protein
MVLKNLQRLCLIALSAMVLTSCLPEDSSVDAVGVESERVESLSTYYAQSFSQYANSSLNALIESPLWKTQTIVEGSIDLNTMAFGNLDLGNAEDMLHSAYCRIGADSEPHLITWFESVSDEGDLEMKGLSDNAAGIVNNKVKTVMSGDLYGIASVDDTGVRIVMKDGNEKVLSGACENLNIPRGSAVAVVKLDAPEEVITAQSRTFTRAENCPVGQSGTITQQISTQVLPDGMITVGGNVYNTEGDLLSSNDPNWSVLSNVCLNDITVASITPPTINTDTSQFANVQNFEQVVEEARENPGDPITYRDDGTVQPEFDEDSICHENSGLNIAYVVDASRSIDDEEWNNMNRFIKAFHRDLPNVEYSTTTTFTSQVQTSISNADRMSSFIESDESLRKQNVGGTNIGGGLANSYSLTNQYLSQSYYQPLMRLKQFEIGYDQYNPSTQARNELNRWIRDNQDWQEDNIDKTLTILITDGRHNYGQEPVAEANKLRKMSNIFVIGIGDEVDEENLQKISCRQDNYEYVDSYADLRSNGRDILDKVCSRKAIPTSCDGEIDPNNNGGVEIIETVETDITETETVTVDEYYLWRTEAVERFEELENEIKQFEANNQSAENRRQAAAARARQQRNAASANARAEALANRTPAEIAAAEAAAATAAAARQTRIDEYNVQRAAQAEARARQAAATRRVQQAEQARINALD